MEDESGKEGTCQRTLNWESLARGKWLGARLHDGRREELKGKCKRSLRRSTVLMNGFLSFVDFEISVKMLCIYTLVIYDILRLWPQLESILKQKSRMTGLIWLLCNVINAFNCYLHHRVWSTATSSSKPTQKCLILPGWRCCCWL